MVISSAYAEERWGIRLKGALKYQAETWKTSSHAAGFPSEKSPCLWKINWSTLYFSSRLTTLQSIRCLIFTGVFFFTAFTFYQGKNLWFRTCCFLTREQRMLAQLFSPNTSGVRSFSGFTLQSESVSGSLAFRKKLDLRTCDPSPTCSWLRTSAKFIHCRLFVAWKYSKFLTFKCTWSTLKETWPFIDKL